MNQHEYVAGFFGVLIGFTLTELLKGIAETFKNLERIKFYNPHAFFVVFLMNMIILNFFDFYKFFRLVEVWTPGLLIRYTFPSVFACFYSYLLFPSFEGNDKIDFRRHFFKVSPILYTLGLIVIILTIMRNIFFIKSDIFTMANSMLSVLFFACLIGLLIKKDWGQYLVLAIAIPAMIYWTSTLRLT